MQKSNVLYSNLMKCLSEGNYRAASWMIGNCRQHQWLYWNS